jgi:hypothetical protein
MLAPVLLVSSDDPIPSAASLSVLALASTLAPAFVVVVRAGFFFLFFYHIVFRARRIHAYLLSSTCPTKDPDGVFLLSPLFNWLLSLLPVCPRGLDRRVSSPQTCTEKEKNLQSGSEDRERA